jgi:peptidoglycan/LPS O-acetylase OafA/YrhL
MLPEGFVSVGIFFVVSGYLIGGHLLQDIQGATGPYAGLSEVHIN